MASQGGGSCLNCRTRKVRCDRILPQCSQCRQRSVECLVPEAPPRFLWLPTRTLGNFGPEQEQFELDMHVRRQLLFRGRQQAQNAADLLSLTSGTSLGAILDQLDTQADEIPNGITASNGPFHAFRYDDPTPESTLSPMSPPDLPDLELWRLVSNNLGDAINEEIIKMVPWTPDLRLADELITASEERNQAISDLQTPHGEQLTAETPALHTLCPSISSSPDLEDFTMSTAKLLLDHYQNISTTLYTPASVETKTPWEVLYVPNVLSTLGEIALTGDSSDAKVSLLFAVLAISAFSLDILGSSSPKPAAHNWHAVGNMYRQRATKRLQNALCHLSSGLPKKEKYKNILMPLLSMVTICTVSGEMKNAAHYLSDIGQIITLYGIPKVQKSRKVKMLHSIYVYLRVLTEGTRIHSQSLANDSSESHPLDAGSCSDSEPTTWELLMGELINTYDTLNLDLMQCLAPPKSTFEQIYSIPDSLFKLILGTTQLASEVERIRHRRRKNTDHDAFAEKVKEHEDRICEWDDYYKQTTYPGDPIGTPPLKERFPYHLTQAIYTALIIYFYRSVRDVNVIALQPYVQQTIYHLREYDKHKEKHKDRSSDMCWPAFIAGCEAITSQSRQQISEWLEKSTRSNGVLMFTVALKAIQKVWAARMLPGKQNLPWSTILGESSEMRVLVLS
ncbi:Zn(II)2Cys6 transcription factor [Aspergillus undulatus]|uniref:Zn(II)2Cys6 transcription factor n=1 Tax=Aspergillus undulatus TaxID=1810928 RepID=UPI003CCE1DA7